MDIELNNEERASLRRILEWVLRATQVDPETDVLLNRVIEALAEQPIGIDEVKP